MYKCNVTLMFIFVICNAFTGVNSEELNSEGLSYKQYKYLEKCKQDFNIDHLYLEKLPLHDERDVPPRHFKCMLACFAEGMGYLKGNKLDWSTIKHYQTMFHEDKRNKTLEVLEVCKNNVKDGLEKCELSFKLAKCLQEEFFKRN